jgi:hypothetical protein
MFPVMLIAIGVAVLVLGKRLAVLGAAVGALLGVGMLGLFSASGDLWLQLAFVGGLAVLGFFVAGFAKGIVDVVLLVIGALGGAAITLGILDLFGSDLGLMRWLLAVAGGAIGLILMRRFRKGSKDWGIIILASLIGALLVTRGLSVLLPFLQDSIWRTLLFVVLAGTGFAYQSDFLTGRKAKPQTQAVASTKTPPPDQKNLTPPPPSN